MSIYGRRDTEMGEPSVFKRPARTKLLERWDLLNRELEFRQRRTDLTNRYYFEDLCKAVLEMCSVEEALGIAHLHNQVKN